MIADPAMASLQESRDAKDNYLLRRREMTDTVKRTVMMDDYKPVSEIVS